MRSALVLFATLLAASAGARQTVSFGADVARSYATADAHIASFHALDHQRTDPIEIATAFLTHKHPYAQYRLQSSGRSASSNVAHTHWLQTLNGRDIVDGTVNVNVDEATGQILSYGDATHVDRCLALEHRFTRTAEAAVARANQKIGGLVMQASPDVLGGSSSVDSEADSFASIMSKQSEKDMADLAACVSPFVGRAGAASVRQDEIMDPRLAVVRFLGQTDGANLLSDDVDEASLVEKIVIEHSFHAEGAASENRITMLNVPGAEEPVPGRLAYVREPGSDALALVWRFEYRSIDNWYEAGVQAQGTDGKTLYAVDWMRDYLPLDAASQAPSKGKPSVPDKKKSKTPAPDFNPHKAAYRIYHFEHCNDPTSCKREIVTDPADYTASPLGWHSVPRASGWTGRTRSSDWLSQPGWSSSSMIAGGFNSTSTIGNNVFAQDNPSGGTAFELNHRPQNDSLMFDYSMAHWSKANRTGVPVDPRLYIDASVTELFSTNNEMHDLFYRYGFDEENGNFQEYNFGRKGKGGDAVVAMAQDGSGTNNANFATPPDGQRPRMRMYVWDQQQPYRDGDLEAGIVTHEYAHGISTRLVGGPANSGCLGWGEAGGMGEGIGDFFGTMLRLQTAKSFTHPHYMGQWAAGRGIRKYPYSTNMTISPETYSVLDGFAYFGVHAIGEVWATMLNHIAVYLIEDLGWSPTLFPPQPDKHGKLTAEAEASFYTTSSITGKRFPKHGNTLIIQLFVDSLKLQPCRPSFFDARDALLAADKHLTGGIHHCQIWRGFAARGLGPNASLIGSTPWGGGKRENDFSFPAAACKSVPS